MKVCLAPSRVLSSPSLGGHAWVYINWTLGLQAHGCEVVWLERFDPDIGPDEARDQLHLLRAHLDAVGVTAPIALLLADHQRERLRGISHDIEEFTVPLRDVMLESRLLLNFYYALEPEVLTQFRRSVLIDIDPGLLQHWIHQNQLPVAEHDWYFTIGETVGAANSLIPDCGLRWHYTPPVVHLDSWPVTPADRDAAYSTVSTWWADWETVDSELFSNEKRTSFLDYLDLPSQVNVPLELALCMTDQEQAERDMLRSKGWRVQDPWQICATPSDYRGFIQRARGEFSCAKPSCLRLSNAWISDRTLCYLASGKPAIVQHTGPSRILPDREGLFRFRDFGEAVEALEEVDAEYEKHSQAARTLAAEHFDAVKIVGRLLEQVAS